MFPCFASGFLFVLFHESFSLFRTRFRLVLLKRTVNRRYDQFEFRSSKLLYTFSWLKVLDCADLGSFWCTVNLQRYDVPASFPLSMSFSVICLLRYSDSDSSVSLIFHAKRMSVSRTVYSPFRLIPPRFSILIISISLAR